MDLARRGAGVDPPAAVVHLSGLDRRRCCCSRGCEDLAVHDESWVCLPPAPLSTPATAPCLPHVVGHPGGGGPLPDAPGGSWGMVVEYLLESGVVDVDHLGEICFVALLTSRSSEGCDIRLEDRDIDGSKLSGRHEACAWWGTGNRQAAEHGIVIRHTTVTHFIHGDTTVSISSDDHIQSVMAYALGGDVDKLRQVMITQHGLQTSGMTVTLIIQMKVQIARKITS